MKTIFEWDESKARSNFEKHKISFDEASTIFTDPLLITFVDDFHSDKEERFISLGLSEKIESCAPTLELTSCAKPEGLPCAPGGFVRSPL